MHVLWIAPASSTVTSTVQVYIDDVIQWHVLVTRSSRRCEIASTAKFKEHVSRTVRSI